MMSRQEPGVAIILLNWNGYKDTFECLESLATLDYPNFSAYVVDNDSIDGSYEKLLEDNKNGAFKIKVKFIQSGATLGFAGGNNVGIQQALEDGYEYFWMLNNDTIVDAASLSELIKVIQENEEIGIVGSKIYYYGTNKIWFAGGKVSYWTGTSRHYGRGSKPV
jgi:GT2 family glycosyltransferase